VVYALAGAGFGVLLILLLLSKRSSRTRTLLAAACGATAVWAGAVALGWGEGGGFVPSLVEIAGTGPWCAFILHLLGKQMPKQRRSLLLLEGCGIVIVLAVLAFAVPDRAASMGPGLRGWDVGEAYARLTLAIYGVLLIENLYRNTAQEFRWHVNLLCLGLGGIFAYGVVLYADALLFHRLSPVLVLGRAVATAMAAPLLAVAAARNRDWAIDIHVSRTVVFHTTTLVASGIFLLALAFTGEVLRMIGPGWGALAEVTLLLAGITVTGVVLASGSLRSRIRGILAEHFYSNRYDYRREWLKSIEILSSSPQETGLQTRAVKAVAEIADSPAGVLWVRDLDGGAFEWAGSWNRPAAPPQPADGEFVALFQDGTAIIELDRLEHRPAWFAEIAQAWIAVPLCHQARIIGFVVLVRPRAPVKLDRETLDLLRIVGCQAAAHIAEQQYAEALSDTQRLGSYAKRFAFAVHDMKNVASQLAMVVQNAPLHRDQPEFHEDVLATVQAALERMNRALASLQPSPTQDAEGRIVPMELIKEEVAAIRARGVAVDLDLDGSGAAVAMHAADFRSVISHLCENAIEASKSPLQIRLRHEGGRIEIDIADDGAGMTPEFIRDKLFQPFGSTKRDGFGIGAYQARELVKAAGGHLFVTSRRGKGTTARVLLPTIRPSVEPLARLAAEESR
jgi:putative PEP-CTERM system histidine kinase